jgi:hypothetical protein
MRSRSILDFSRESVRFDNVSHPEERWEERFARDPSRCSKVGMLVCLFIRRTETRCASAHFVQTLHCEMINLKNKGAKSSDSA